MRAACGGQTCLVRTPVVRPLFNDLARSSTSTPDGFISEPPSFVPRSAASYCACSLSVVKRHGPTARELNFPRWTVSECPGQPQGSLTRLRPLPAPIFGSRHLASEAISPNSIFPVLISARRSLFHCFTETVRLLAPASSPFQHSIFSMAATTCATWSRWT